MKNLKQKKIVVNSNDVSTIKVKKNKNLLVRRSTFLSEIGNINIKEDI